MDSEGRANRGDRLQIQKLIFQNNNGAQLPLERRMRLVWKAVTGPLLRMELQDKLLPRLKELLQYLLVSLVGRHAEAFGALYAASVGIHGDATLSTWESFEAAIKNNE